MLIVKDGANNLRLIVWSSTTEYGVATNISHWTAGQWHKVTATWDADSIAIYVDGILMDRREGIQLPASLTTNMYVGSTTAGMDQANAILDELVIYAGPQPSLFDLNGNYVIDVGDIIIIAEAWPCAVGSSCQFDFDVDGDTDMVDVMRLARRFACTVNDACYWP